MRKGIAALATAMASLLAAGAAFGARAPTQDILSQYEKTGEFRSCIPLRSIRDTDFLDDYTMMVTVTGGDVYLNEFSSRCAGVYREQRYYHKTSTNDMCRGDIIRVVDAFGSPRGACGLSQFEKLEQLPQPEEQ